MSAVTEIINSSKTTSFFVIKYALFLFVFTTVRPFVPINYGHENGKCGVIIHCQLNAFMVHLEVKT